MASWPKRPTVRPTRRRAPPLPPRPPDEAPKSYSSLSLLALGGLAVAVVYAVVVLVGAAVALFYRMPWILPTWSLAVPLAAVVLCWAARVQIQNSEGALTGARLTVWGLWLSLAVGLLYAAYYSACYLSVTGMATKVADEMLDDIKNDRLDKAFLLGLPPPRPADDAGLRARLELEFDRGRGSGGPFTLFRQSELVRQIQQGGAADQIQCLGVKDWGPTAGGYQVQLAYSVSTPFETSEALVTVVGVNSTDDSGGRQWYVKPPQMAGTPVLTDEGRRMADRGSAAHVFAGAWLAKVADWNWDQAYLDTLPPRERQREAKDRGPKFKEGLQVFRDGGLVHAESPTFWAGDKDREIIIARVKSLFGHGGGGQDKMSLDMAMPTYRTDGDLALYGFDVTIALPPAYAVQGRLTVAADVRNGEPGPDDWQIESLDLISGKSMGAEGGGPPRPGMPPPMGKP